MKTKLSILMLLTFFTTFAQNKFELSSDAPVFPPSKVIIDVFSSSFNEDTFNLVNNWLISSHSSSAYVLLKGDSNDCVKIAFTVDDLYEENSHVFKKNLDVRYEITLQCINKQVYLEINNLQVYFPETTTSGGWENISINYSDLFKKNGEINLKKKQTLSLLQNHFNDFVFSLESYLRPSENSLSITYY